jgi:predicted nicotinamide N-methyase
MNTFAWPSSYILRDFIKQHYSCFVNYKILEIGSGNGNLLEEFTDLNITGSDIIPGKNIIYLDWNSCSGKEKYDVILGSDVFYNEKDFYNILVLYKKKSKRNSVFITVYQDRSAFSVTALVALLNLKIRVLKSEPSFFVYEITKKQLVCKRNLWKFTTKFTRNSYKK